MALTPTLIRVGAGFLYFGTTAPASGSPLALTSGVPATGTGVGLTQGDVMFHYQTTYLEVEADQVLAAVKPFAIKEEMALEFSVLEYSASNILKFLGQANLTTDNISTPNTDLFTMGGSSFKSAVNLSSVTLVSAIPGTSPQRYTVVMLYQAFQAEAAQASFSKDKVTLLKSKWTAVPDLTRTDGDYLGQLVVERNA